MTQLDEKKALEMMGLSPDVTKDEVSKRYGVLTRKFKNIEKDENGYTIEDMTRAYHLLMGITFVDKKEEERQKALRENPPLIARILKKDPVKLENFFHYYRLHMILSLVIIVFLVFTIRSCINRVPPDFNLVFHGNIYTNDQTALEAKIKELMPELAAPSVQFMSSMESDAEYQYAMQMKLMAMLAAKEIDVMIMDESSFNTIASQGMLMPLDDVMETLGFPEENYVKAQEIIDRGEDGKTEMGPVKYYGVDITEQRFIKDSNLIGKKMIAAIVVNTGRVDKAISFIQKQK